MGVWNSSLHREAVFKALDLLAKPLRASPLGVREKKKKKGTEVTSSTFAALIAPLNLFRGRLLIFSVPSVSSSERWADVT